jgi:hypothetical protein
MGNYIQDYHGKGAIQQEKGLFDQQIGLKCNEKVSEILYFEHKLLCCQKLDTLESRSELPGKFLTVVLEKEGDQR